MTEEESEIRLGTCKLNSCRIVLALFVYCLFPVHHVQHKQRRAGDDYCLLFSGIVRQ